MSLPLPLPPFDLPVTGEDRLLASALTGAKTDKEITRAAQHIRQYVDAETAKLRAAADPFVRVHRLNESHAPSATAPLRDYCPGVWPTMGDLRKLAAAAAG